LALTAARTASQTYFRYENHRRDKVYGKVDRLAEVDTSELADWVRYNMRLFRGIPRSPCM
jgi:hypothetical protein